MKKRIIRGVRAVVGKRGVAVLAKANRRLLRTLAWFGGRGATAVGTLLLVATVGWGSFTTRPTVSATALALLVGIAIWSARSGPSESDALVERATREDFRHRQLLAAVEGGTLGVADRSERLESLLAVELRTVSEGVTGLTRVVEGAAKAQSTASAHAESALTKEIMSQTQEIEALLQLYRDHRPSAPMPPAGRWALNPTSILELLDIVGREEPGVVVELGSGTSTVWLAYALQKYGGHLISVDHEAEFLGRTRINLERHDLSALVDLRLAPLAPVTIGDEDHEWYDALAFDGVSGIDLLLVDGPPGVTAPLARYPALPVLADRLSAVATVILDDAHRAEEQEVLRLWLEEYPELARRPTVMGPHAVLSYERSDPR